MSLPQGAAWRPEISWKSWKKLESWKSQILNWSRNTHSELAIGARFRGAAILEIVQLIFLYTRYSRLENPWDGRNATKSWTRTQILDKLGKL